MQALGYQKPEHHQRRIDAVVEFYPGFRLGLLEESRRQEFLEAGGKAANRGLVNDRRERECVSCVNPGYRESLKMPSTL
jgi:hypothetical protein